MSPVDLIQEPAAPIEWLIRKGGYFYRRNWCGYTTVKAEAGRYTEAEARKEAEVEPWHMSAIHQDAVPDPAGDINVIEIASLKATLASKDTALAEIRAENDAFEKDCEYWSSETARVCGEASTLAAELERERELKDHARKCCDAAEAELALVKKALAFADEQSAKVEALIEPHIMRICPMRDGPCPHGMSCPFVGDGYHGYPCKDGWSSSRAASRAVSQEER